MSPVEGSWTEDRQWARSRIFKGWTPDGKQLSWILEVRSPSYGVGSVRLGEIRLTGSVKGELTMSIDEEQAWR